MSPSSGRVSRSSSRRCHGATAATSRRDLDGAPLLHQWHAALAFDERTGADSAYAPCRV